MAETTRPDNQDRPAADGPRLAAPGWAGALNRLAEAIIRDRPSGRVPLHVAIDAHKALTGPFVLALMVMYDAWSGAAWVYLALHGAYGVSWVLKDLAYPDRRWHRRVSLIGATGALLFLSLYWVAPILLVTGAPGAGWSPAPAWGLAIAVAVHTLGLVLMIGADVHKNAMLACERRLVTTGFFRFVRHPNYLGEMLVYGSYALIVNHWLPWVILAAIWLLFFLPNMLAIEASISRYPEYGDWARRTGFLLPRFRH